MIEQKPEHEQTESEREKFLAEVSRLEELILSLKKGISALMDSKLGDILSYDIIINYQEKTRKYLEDLRQEILEKYPPQSSQQDLSQDNLP